MTSSAVNTPNTKADAARRDFLKLHFAKVKAIKLDAIEARFGSISQAMSASQADWQAADLLTPRQFERLFDSKIDELVQQAEDWAQEENHHILCLGDERYPSMLAEISDPPILLYAMGQVNLLKDPQIGIVGSRNATKYGIGITKDFAQYFIKVGMTVTSGLASGIDQAAHEGALTAYEAASDKTQGTTIAVVATGLDRVYPASNRELAHKICQAGVIVSEYPLGTKPLAHQFPERNRIISGLSVGVLVVEAALKSGSLITARLAMEQGREVFAVPGSINSPHSKGCHQLIRQGAKLAESGQDVLEDLSSLIQLSLLDNVLPDTSQVDVRDNKATEREKEKSLLQWIEYEPVSLDELAVLSKWPVSDIQSQLLILEVTGEIEAMSAGRWRRLK
ncbi:DNA-processing protein DprA [Hydrogenovibrio kuenenii]|uniref:DNA-processing protein DprA n=1 Tax=Hydrogenovibrio kuenenii TaxID=63658 RepID=UPI000463902E|nr:DNA-processing protein DprA [Hydrogenovibrio kuenenii]